MYAISDQSLRSLNAARERGFLSAENRSETEMRMIHHTYVSGVFEAALYDLSRDVTEKYIHTIV